MTDIRERLAGPHEWGYRDVTDGKFIEDTTPFEAADTIDQLVEALEASRMQINNFRDRFQEPNTGGAAIKIINTALSRLTGEGGEL